MDKFNGEEYLQIDIANCFGLDRLSWQDRLFWFKNNQPDLELLDGLAKSPVLYRKAVRAWRKHQLGFPVNHVMGLDATSSGIQIMGILSGCIETCKATNVINTGVRQCVYAAIAEEMNKIAGIKVTRDDVKKPVMTVCYGSTAQPKSIFGQGKALDAFYEALYKRIPGAMELMSLFQKHWQPFTTVHTWKLPDKHVAYVPVTKVVEKPIEIDEANHLRFVYRTEIQTNKTHSRSLAANIVHSIDGYIVRQMVLASKQQGFLMAPIHDCFYAHPNYMDNVRQNYNQILAWIANRNLVPEILSQIAGRKVSYTPHSNQIADYVRDANYSLS